MSVDYEFVNESMEDITTEIAFPVPEYEDADDASEHRDLGTFRAWVDGSEFSVAKEVHALVGSDRRNIAPPLRRLGISTGTFGSVPTLQGRWKNQLEGLSPATLDRLVKAGALDDADSQRSPFPARGSVAVTWHWK